MGQITKPEDARYFMAYGGSIYHIGRTDTNQVTSSGMPNFVIGNNIDDFLQKTEAIPVDDFNPLPAFGEPVNAGEVYTYNGKLVIARQDHDRTADEPADVPALFSTYRVGGDGILDWVPNEQVMVGDIRKYNTVEYVVIQSHTTQSDWTPDIVPALFALYSSADGVEWVVGQRVKQGQTRTRYNKTFTCLVTHVTANENEPYADKTHWSMVTDEWVQPAGAHDAYRVGDRVYYLGQTYESTIDANVWAPDVTGWVIVS